MWTSVVPEKRWTGFRRLNKGVAAFASLSEFEKAAMDELLQSLADHELVTLGRLLERGKKAEIESFIRTHGANPLFDPQRELEWPVGVVKADVVPMSRASSEEANRAILDGKIVHVFFQAGEASRFQEGPFYALNPLTVAEKSNAADTSVLVQKISEAKKSLAAPVASLLADWPLGPKQPLLLRASVRRVIQLEIDSGRLAARAAMAAYKKALGQQKLLFFVSQRSGLSQVHDQSLRLEKNFYGFHPENVITIEQEQAQGITCDERGELQLLSGEDWADAAGHLYALIQAARNGDFTTYTESGRPIKPMELDALAYFSSRGAKILSIIRINDMDRHTTDIVNPKALAYALKIFEEGYVNAIEAVANPSGQKGGTGTTFGDPAVHMLTETHENSFPALSRAFEAAMKEFLHANNDRHPSYNAMRQWADLPATRRVLKEFGGRIVFVPRQRTVDGKEVFYLGVDMPMGDLSLLSEYKSRMFQFEDESGQELLIHDMKQKENLGLALQALLTQMTDPHVVAAAEELAGRGDVPFLQTA